MANKSKMKCNVVRPSTRPGKKKMVKKQHLNPIAISIRNDPAFLAKKNINLFH